MPITSIITQPSFQSRNPAYSPVYFRVKATATDGSPLPPVLFCDIYFNGIYYKTIAKTQPVLIESDGSQWEFDVQDAAQERVTYTLPPINGDLLIPAVNNVVECFCRFRSSGINSQGFIQSDGTEPVQATGMLAAVPGGGEESLMLFIIAATLQQDDAQNFPVMLNEYKTGSWKTGGPPIYYPLSHRPARYYMAENDSDYFTVLAPNAAALITGIKIFYRPRAGTTFLSIETSFLTPTQGAVVHLPTGPANLQSIFPTLTFGGIAEYFVEFSGTAGTLLSTPVIVLAHPCEDAVRLHFVNSLGGIDGISLKKVVGIHETKSGQYQRPFQYPFNRSEHAAAKFNNKANETYTAISNDYGENQQEWIAELLDAPAVWLTVDIYGQGRDYLPVIIADGKIDLLKEEDRFTYQVEITYSMSHEKVLLRN